MVSLRHPFARAAKRGAPLLFLLAASCTSEPTRQVAFVANSGANQIQVIDLDSGRTVREIHSGAGPWRLLASPDRAALWVQNWTSGTTAVIDLKSLQVQETLPFRGPGIFSSSGDRFLTFDWPDYSLSELDAGDGHLLDRHATEVAKVANLANATPSQLYLLQQDLLSEAEGPRFSYVLAYDPKAAARSAPKSLRTGLNPEDILVPPGQPFFLTADRGTDGISIINSAGDRRSLRVCPAPRRLSLSGDGLLLAVGCWRADTGTAGEVVLFSVDFSARPWPVMEERGRTPMTAVADLQFSPDGDRLYGIDEVFDRLVEWDAKDLGKRRQIALGSKPRDLAIMAVPLSVASSWEEGPDPDSALMEALERNHSWGAPFDSLGWTEIVSWREADGADETGPPPGPPSWKVSQFLNGKGAIRSDSPSGWRIADSGWSYSIREDGRFWRTPRLELLGRVLALPNLSRQEAIRLMAGDFPRGPFQSGGIATDVFCRHETPDGPVFIWGASGPDEPVNQVWIEATTGAPLRLIERLPGSSGSGHAGGAAATIDTRFLQWNTLDGGAKLPARLERVIDGRVQDVVFENPGAVEQPDGFFDLVQLGGVRASADYLPQAASRTDEVSPPIMAGDYLSTPWTPHPAYSTNPPTSGPRVRELVDWGVHDYPIPLALQVHNLEHGGVIAQYNCARPCEELRENLESLTRMSQPVIVAPSPYLGSRLALTAWGHILTLDEWDAERIQQFMQRYAGIDHHGEP